MTRKSTLNEDMLQREWLVDKVYNPKKTRSLELATKSIEKLLERNQKVTLQAIHDISKVIDPDGEGIHRNTITTN
jgi:plasmid maintenance system antidote protein VapI